MELYHGDCLQVMKDIPDASVDMVLTDPPYGTTACKWDSVIPFDKMWEQLNRITKIHSVTCLFGSEPFSSALRMSNIRNYKYDWIWDKKFAGNFALSKYQPQKIHENILIFSKGTGYYYPIMMKRDIPIRKGGNKCDWESSKIDRPKEEYNNKIYDYKYPESIIHISSRSEKRGLHPTQKPVALLEYLIQTYTNKGDTVLDFTMGSGSTGVACVNTGRDFIGIELDEQYFNVAKDRIYEVTK